MGENATFGAKRVFHPISEVEVVDTSKKEIIQTFQLVDPEFQLHLKSDQEQKSKQQKERSGDRAHLPESKEHYDYVARIRLEA
jgi:hypothetical protein